MTVLYDTKDEYGRYPGIQEADFETVPPGCLEFPPEKWDVLFPPDKKSGGFVDLQVEGGRIVDVTWNEEAYQAWLESRPEPVEPEPAPPSLEGRIAALEAENAALTAAVERGLSL